MKLWITNWTFHDIHLDTCPHRMAVFSHKSIDKTGMPLVVYNRVHLLLLTFLAQNTYGTRKLV